MSTAEAIQSCGGRLVPDMRNEATVTVIIPALNEEKAIGRAISEISPWAAPGPSFYSLVVREMKLLQGYSSLEFSRRLILLGIGNEVSWVLVSY
jgi:hypothetical protein